eukprot:2530983-Pleurochrysis_carterae.AAC.1
MASRDHFKMFSHAWTPELGGRVCTVARVERDHCMRDVHFERWLPSDARTYTHALNSVRARACPALSRESRTRSLAAAHAPHAFTLARAAAV